MESRPKPKDVVSELLKIDDEIFRLIGNFGSCGNFIKTFFLARKLRDLKNRRDAIIESV
ncbi:hypothetical protein DSCO28_73130 (plasmid) [Desulfosarcina ovata subsp. sediminis]|uniref:Uncharacterized protein n=1 Tax=Desulfosarcina ovata subsp. sediminis TaxID=885957 RepID=A0A5K8A2M5_9BACT|nr:hypothetical protein [Desulfosarcina ovata]BBO86747.1 hypothetical protein DSCO28_73130 [Desulfosarcina ovata subsp. sediminis]